MNLFENRPFAFAAFCAVALTLVLYVLGVTHLWIFSAILLLCAVLLCVVGVVRRRCGKRQSTAILVCLLSAVLLFSAWRFFDCKIGFLEEQKENRVTAVGVITARQNSGAGQSSFALELEELDGKRVRQKVLLECDYLSALRVGERISVSATVGKFMPASENPEIAFYIADGFSGVLACADFRDCTVLASGKRSLRVMLSEWNDALTEGLMRRLGNREGGLAAALVLGNRTGLNAVDALAFRRTGIAHFLALSGLHVGILMVAVERLLRLLRIPRKFRVGGMILLSVGYLAVTGASPSTIRAVCMAALLSVAFLLRRSYDSPTAVFAVLFGILAVQPYSIVDRGLWLSFFAAGGIVIFVPAFRKLLTIENLPPKAVHPLKRWAKALLLSACVGLFAFSATLPLSAFFFGEASVLSVPATLILSPLFSVGLILSVLSLLVPIPPVAFLAQKVLLLLRLAASGISRWRNITVRLQGIITVILLVALAASLFLCAVLKFRKKGFLAVPLALAVLVFLSAYSITFFKPKEVQVEYFSQTGNEYLLFTNGGKAVVADISSGSKNDAQDLVNGLHSAGCTELEELIFTHYHTPSTYLLNRIAAKVKIRTLVLPTPMDGEETAVAARLEQEATLLGIRSEFSNQSCTVPGLTVQWMHDEGMSEPAITLVAKTEASGLVWCNSQFASAEQTKFFRQYAPDANVFLFGQHGSTTGLRREIPLLQAERVFVGQWKSNAAPFLPPEKTFYQTVVGSVVFSLS